jgi:hypothetical protein
MQNSDDVTQTRVQFAESHFTLFSARGVAYYIYILARIISGPAISFDRAAEEPGRMLKKIYVILCE